MSSSRARQERHVAEEHQEVEKHRNVYTPIPPERLAMCESDWEKVRNPTPSCAYYASMARLGDIRGSRILDAGCGDGWCSVILAKLGARVSGFDVSPEAIRTAEQRAAVNDVADVTDFQVASIYDIPFDSDSFDIVMGQAILHHVRDKGLAAHEIRRVLAPNGRGLFVECFGGSRILERIRRLVPVQPEGDPNDWQHKINDDDLSALREVFETRVHYFQLFSRLDRVVGGKTVVSALNGLDQLVLSRVPPLRRLSRTVLIELD